MRETAKDKGRLQHILSYRKSVFFACLFYRKSVFLRSKFIGKLWFVFGMWLVFSTFDI